MKHCLVILLGLFWIVPPVFAQVGLDLVLDQEQYLRDESLPVKVRVVNRSGQTLHLGKEPDWISFHLESREGRVLTPRKEPESQGEFTLESSQVGTRQVDLMPCYDLTPGRYSVSATLKISQWGIEIMSGRTAFEIIRGINMREEVVGVPREEGPPEPRRYTLQQASYLRQPYLYARVSDLEGNRAFGVLPLGRLLSFSKPETQIDRASHLHVLFQTGPRSFTYCEVSPHGQMVRRQRHDYTETRPSLKMDPDGSIGVAGGIRRVSRFDIPAPETVLPTYEVPSPAP